MVTNGKYLVSCLRHLWLYVLGWLPIPAYAGIMPNGIGISNWTFQTASKIWVQWVSLPSAFSKAKCPKIEFFNFWKKNLWLF